MRRPPPIDVSDVSLLPDLALGSGDSPVAESPFEASATSLTLPLRRSTSSAPDVTAASSSAEAPQTSSTAPSPQALSDTGLTISGGTENTDYTINAAEKKIVITSSKTLTVSGTSQGYTLEIAAGVHATLVLDNVTIAFSRDLIASPDKGRIPLNIATNLMDTGGTERTEAATEGNQIANKTSLHLLLADGSTNTLVGGTGAPGLRCGEGSILVIDDSVVNYDKNGNHVTPFEGRVPADLTLGNGTSIKKGDPLYTMDSANPGKLVSMGGAGGAGIGSAPHENAGDITIDGGVIEAQAYGNDNAGTNEWNKTGAGIGGSYGGGGTSITINGGVVRAVGSCHGAGIGAGCTSLPANTTNSVPAYDKDILPGIMLTREYKNGQRCRDITVNGGNVVAQGFVHGFALGDGCGGQSSQGHALTITGGNIATTRDTTNNGVGGNDGGGYLGASGLDVIVQGGSFNVPYFGFTTNPSTTQVTDGRGNPLTMVEIDLAGYDGLAGAQLKSLTVTIDGAPITDAEGNAHRYGLPYGVDSANKVYFWLPDTANGKEVSIKDFAVSTLKPDGSRDETTSDYPFVVPNAGNGAIAKRYVEINIDDYVAKVPDLRNLLVKRYDGVPISLDDQFKQTVAGFKVPAGEPKGEVIDNAATMHLSSHRLTDRDGNATNEPVQPGGSYANAGAYEVIIDSDEWAADVNFSRSFWGHKLYLSSAIEPADSEVSVVTHTLDYGNVTGTDPSKLSAVNLTANVMPRTKPSGDLPAEKTTCASPDGFLQFFANGVSVGDPVALQPATDKTPEGYAYSTASYSWSDFKRYQIPRNLQGTVIIQGKYLGGTNYNPSDGLSTEIPADEAKDIPFIDTPEVVVKPQNPDPDAPPVPELKPEGPPTVGPPDPEAENKDLINTLHSTVHDRYSIPVDENGASLGPDDLLKWAEERYGIPEGCTLEPVVLENPDGTPASEIVVSSPGSYVVRVPVKDRVTGNTTTIVVDFSVVNPPQVAKPEGSETDEKRPLPIDKVTHEPNQGTVHGESSDSVERPVRPGVTDTPDSVRDWIEDYYDIPEGSTVSTPVLKDEHGNPVDSIDAGTPGHWIVEFTVTDEQGNTSTVTVDYVISPDTEPKPDAPGNDDSGGNGADDGNGDSDKDSVAGSADNSAGTDKQNSGGDTKPSDLRTRLAQTGDPWIVGSVGILAAGILSAAALALARRRTSR